MLKNIIRVALRNLKKNKTHTLINVFGLSAGITSALLIFMILRFNLSFDNYHEDPGRIYRLVVDDYTDGKLSHDAGIPYPLRLSFEDDFPGVESLTMVDDNALYGLVTLEREGEKVKFLEDSRNQAFVMPGYFDIFKYEFLVGDPKKVFEHKKSVVLSKGLAEKYFGDHLSAVGQSLTLENLIDVKVTGIVADAPMNTDLRFDMLISFDTGESERVWDSWGSTSSSVQCYIKLRPGVDQEQFGKKIVNYIKKHKGEDSPDREELRLQPLADLHHNKNYSTYSGRVMTRQEIITLAAIGILLIVAASINFVNLNTAVAAGRSKEIGIRKVLGSDRRALVLQFLGETAWVTFFSILLSFGLAELGILKIESLIGYDLPPTHYDGVLVGSILALFVLVTLLSGLYPALIISGFRPIAALKNKLGGDYRKGLSVRRSLIIVQLLISQVLIVAVLVITQQIRHFINTPIGIDSHAIVEFPLPTDVEIDLSSFKNVLLSQAGVEKVTFSNTGTTSENSWSGLSTYNNGSEIIREHLQVKVIDETYLDTYGLKLLAGRNVQVDSVRRYLITEETMRALNVENYDDAIGRELNVWGTPGEIIGVVKDFNAMSLHYSRKPVAMWASDRPDRYILGAVKMSAGNWDQAIAFIQQEWEKRFPDFIFSYTFLDDTISQFYKSEKRTSKIFTAFAAMAIFIGSIGLFGLMSYMVQTRTKEIGVRKVLGAQVRQIVHLLTRDFVKLVLVAFALAVPLSWYLMNGWLQDFASRIAINFWIYLVGLACSLLITVLAVGLKSFKAAIINPVEVLKDE